MEPMEAWNIISRNLERWRKVRAIVGEMPPDDYDLEEEAEVLCYMGFKKLDNDRKDKKE